MTTVLPKRAYRDPSTNIDEIQREEAKIEHGCAICSHKGNSLGFGFWDCKLGRARNAHGYCRRWFRKEECRE